VRGHLDGKGTVAVAGGQPNGWGFHDMLGNVAEWCHDWYGPYEPGDQTDPVGRADGIARVTRGWSCLKVNHPAGSARYARPANRSGHLPEDANRVTGFRVAMGGMPSTPPLPVPAPVPLPERPPPAEPGSDPFYIDYAKEKRGPVLSEKAWGPIFAKWNHFTTACVCPNGDVLAVWYSTVQESGRECAQAVSRLPAGGDRWGPAQFFFGVPDVNTHAPVLLRHGDRLIHFATQSLAGWDDAADVMRVSEDNGVSWSKPRIILSRDDPMTMSQPCAAIVAGDGSLVLAVDGDRGHRDERILTSRDGGRTWTVGKGDLRKAAGRYAIHPTLVQRSDGSILTFLRGPDPMAAFATTDFGANWTKVDCALPGIGVGQKAATLRLAGGALLIASQDRKKELVGGGTYVALSDNDGRTWSHVRKAGGPVGYLSLAQGPDATIYLIGSRLRFAAFNEAWVREGKPLR
jgi:hypothetical protein